MAMLSDTLGNALFQFRVGDHTVAIENDLPFIIHLEGQNLQKLVHALPADQRSVFSDVVVDATRHLIEAYSGLLAYNHASEVSLLFRFRDSQRKALGSYGEMTTSVASTLSAAIVHFAGKRLPALFNADGSKLVLPQFFATSYAFPSTEIASRFFLWRETAGRRASIGAVALKHFKEQEIAGKSTVDRKAMLASKGIDFDAIDEHVRRGSFIRRFKVERDLDPSELAKIPAQHRPNRPVMTTTVDRVRDVPPLALIDNLESFIFDNAGPVLGDRPFAAAITI
jgi:tRNA(His) 5'-end guanylyltransferase